MSAFDDFAPALADALKQLGHEVVDFGQGGSVSPSRRLGGLDLAAHGGGHFRFAGAGRRSCRLWLA
jgi:hypothetical protein